MSAAQSWAISDVPPGLTSLTMQASGSVALRETRIGQASGSRWVADRMETRTTAPGSRRLANRMETTAVVRSRPRPVGRPGAATASGRFTHRQPRWPRSHPPAWAPKLLSLQNAVRVRRSGARKQKPRWGEGSISQIWSKAVSGNRWSSCCACHTLVRSDLPFRAAHLQGHVRALKVPSVKL